MAMENPRFMVYGKNKPWILQRIKCSSYEFEDFPATAMMTRGESKKHLRGFQILVVPEKLVALIRIFVPEKNGRSKRYHEIPAS